MSFRIAHECPQCAAPIALEEVDRVLRCPYCGVKHFMISDGPLRLMLPHGPHAEMVYIPYIRFKGCLYTCTDSAIVSRVVDMTLRGMNMPGFPLSLGVRPQAMTLSIARVDEPGTFLASSLSMDEVFGQAGRHTKAAGAIEHYRASIGETVSIVYQPAYVGHGRLYDAVLDRPVAPWTGPFPPVDVESGTGSPWNLTFFPMLCPRCGWDLDGERDSVVITCPNCTTMWEGGENQLKPVEFGTAESRTPCVIYLPFWRIMVSGQGGMVPSFAEFLRVTRQPVLIRKEWEQESMAFWVPAFKIRPRLFLRVGSQLTVTHPSLRLKKVIPPSNLFPVTLPRTEACQSLTLIVAASAMAKSLLFPTLREIEFHADSSALVYLPFRQSSHDLIEDHTGLTLPRKAVEWGRAL